MVKLGPLTKEQVEAWRQRDVGPVEAADETRITWTNRRRIQFTIMVLISIGTIGLAMLNLAPDEPKGSLPTCKPFEIITTGVLDP